MGPGEGAVEQGSTAGMQVLVHVPKEMAAYAPTPMMNLSHTYAAPVRGVTSAHRPVTTAAVRSLYIASDSTRALLPVPHVNVATDAGSEHAEAVAGEGMGAAGGSGIGGFCIVMDWVGEGGTAGAELCVAVGVGLGGGGEPSGRFGAGGVMGTGISGCGGKYGEGTGGAAAGLGKGVLQQASQES